MSAANSAASKMPATSISTANCSRNGAEMPTSVPTVGLGEPSEFMVTMIQLPVSAVHRNVWVPVPAT